MVVRFCNAQLGKHGHRFERTQEMRVGMLLCGFAWNTRPQICALTSHVCWYAFVWLCLEYMATDLCAHKTCMSVRFCVALHGKHGHRSVHTQEMRVGTLLCGFAWNTWPQICAHTRHVCWYAFVWLCLEYMATDLCAYKKCVLVRFCVALHGKHGHRSVRTQDMHVGTLLCGFAWKKRPQICVHTRNACWYAFVWLCMEYMATDLCAHKKCMSVRFCVALHGKHGHRSVSMHYINVLYKCTVSMHCINALFQCTVLMHCTGSPGAHALCSCAGIL